MTLTPNRNASRNRPQAPTPRDVSRAAAPKPPAPAAPLQGPGGLSLTVERIDAARAQALLNVNMVNRSIRRSKLRLMVSDMLEGRWRPVGDPVREDATGALCDGQHRMMALVEAAKVKPDIAFDFIMIRGVDPEDRKVIDTGSARTPGDQLKIKGYRNHTVLAHAAKWMIFWETEQFGVDASARALSHSQVVDYVEEHPRLEEVVAHCAAHYRHVGMPVGYLGMAYYILTDIDEEAAHDFFERLSEGFNLERDSALLRLRNKCLDLRRIHATLDGEMWISMFFRAWNAHRQNKPLRALVYDRPVNGDPDVREAIPCPQPI